VKSLISKKATAAAGISLNSQQEVNLRQQLASNEVKEYLLRRFGVESLGALDLPLQAAALTAIMAGNLYDPVPKPPGASYTAPKPGQPTPTVEDARKDPSSVGPDTGRKHVDPGAVVRNGKKFFTGHGKEGYESWYHN
jgi:hypothetical protein